jgi:hypothetical protein
MLGEYDAKFYVNGKTMREAKRYYGATSIKKLSRTVYVYEGDKISGLKKDYLKSIQPDKYTDSLIVRKSRSFPLRSKNGRGDYDNYYTMLKLGKHPKSEWRQRIQEFQSIINGYTSQFVNIDTLEVPQSFIDARKKQRISTGQIKGTGVASGPRRVKLKGEMICKQAVDLERWVDGKNCKWVSKTYDMAKFHQNPFLLIYGKQEDMDKMDKWFRPTRSLKIELAVLSERELKLVEKIELHNLMSFSKFMEGKNKKFQRIATACFIDKLTDDYKYVFRNVEALQPISTDLHDKVVSLTNYRNVNFRSLDDDIRDTIIEHAKENKAFDLSMYSTAVEIENICKKLPFLDAMMSNIRYYGDLDSEKPLLTALKDLFKYHKHRIDWKNYRIRFNEDLPLEETLTSETVEQLVQQD